MTSDPYLEHYLDEVPMTLVQEAEEPIEHLKSLMIEKLSENEHKASWKGTPVWGLIKRFTEEVYEFYEAFDKYTWNESPETKRNLEREIGDVGNFLMMIADNLRGQLGSTKENT